MCPGVQLCVCIGRSCGLGPGETVWASYRADASFRVAGVRVAVTLAQFAVSQVQTSTCASVSGCTVLEEKQE